MTLSAHSVAGEVDRILEERSRQRHPCDQPCQHCHIFEERHRNDASERESVLGTARRCAHALWSFLDGVYEAQIAPEAAG